MSQKQQLKVFVTGPTGTTGRTVTAELLKRGHLVTGFSKNPAKYGTHPNYTPVSGTVMNDLNVLKAVGNNLSKEYIVPLLLTPKS